MCSVGPVLAILLTLFFHKGFHGAFPSNFVLHNLAHYVLFTKVDQKNGHNPFDLHCFAFKPTNLHVIYWKLQDSFLESYTTVGEHNSLNIYEDKKN